MSSNPFVDHTRRRPYRKQPPIPHHRPFGVSSRTDSSRTVSILAFLVLFLPFCAGPFSPPGIMAGGSQEAAGMDRAGYLAGQQRIIRPEEVRIDSYISGVDYGYPDPEGDVGVTLLLDSVGTIGRTAGDTGSTILQIGIQGRRLSFGELPTMNLVFVLDVSGSMSGEGKIEAARRAFDTMLETLRDEDIISAVVFAEEVTVIIQPTRLATVGNRDTLIERLSGVRPYGGSNLSAGLRAGYEQAASRYDSKMVNRVILVSDGSGISPENTGQGSERRTEDIVEEYHRNGIGLTTVTVGTTADVAGMSALSRVGGGSSRFMPNEDRAAELFDTGFDRMIVPAASDLEILLDLRRSEALEVEADTVMTWGYDHEYVAGSIRYTLPSLHVRDYETILVELGDVDSNVDFTLTVRYRDWKGSEVVLGPFDESDVSNREARKRGERNEAHTRAATMLRFAQGLEDIGVLYYSVWDDFQYLYATQNRIFDVPYLRQQTPLDVVAEREYEELSRSIKVRRLRALEIVIGLTHLVRSAREVLTDAALSDEEAILRTYYGILTRELMLDPDEAARLLNTPEP